MKRKKVSTTVYITPDQDKNLKTLSTVTDRAVAAYIREGIDLVLEKYRDRMPRQLTLLPEDDGNRGNN